MRICFIGKYPPIEGGVSSRLYWLAKGLGLRGHEVHVVTNALEVEREYRERLRGNEDLDNYQPKNVFVHNTDPFDNPQFIPFSKPYFAKLASLAIEVVRDYDLEIIDSWYMLPYVISGFLVKSFTHKPQILRHAGSDMSRLFSSRNLNSLFRETIKAVDMIATNPKNIRQFVEMGVSKEKIFSKIETSVNTGVFNPAVTPYDLSRYREYKQNAPTITYIGKFGFTKGIPELFEALSRVKKPYNLLLVSGGEGQDILKQLLSYHNLSKNTILLGFVPPWKIPPIIKASTVVVHAENDFPIVGHSPILPYEVMAVGTCLILSEELYRKRKSAKIINGENILVVNPGDINSFRELLEKVIDGPQYALKVGKKAREVSEQIEDFDGYLSQNEILYKKLLKVFKS